MNKAKVSIIVPIYNVEAYLKKCLDSLINQTFKDIEILAISDGSPDNSVEIIKEYSKKDQRVKCIEKENGGYGSVLEYAIKNMKTEYFLVCDPDDWLHEDAIKILYEKASQNDLDITYGSYYYVYSNDNEEEYTDGACFQHVFKPKKDIVYTGDDVYNFAFLAPSPHAKLYRTKVAKDIIFPHKISYTDFILYMGSLMNSKRVMYTDEALAYYLIDRVGNTTTDVKAKIADYHYEVFNSILKQYNRKKISFNNFHYRMFLHYIYINSEIQKISNKEEYLEKRELIYKLLVICSNYRQKIYPYLEHETKKKRMIYKLLLSPITRRIAFLYISNKNYHSKEKR